MRPEKKEPISDLDLNDIIDDYYDSIWSYSLFLSGHNPDAAEEITQEVFLCLIEKWHVIKKENVGGWLFGVARRKFYEYIKAKKKEKKHLLYYDDPDSPFFSDKNEAAIFDDEYLINLDKSKTSQENIENNLISSTSSSLIQSVNNRREINHICMVKYENSKYIVTTGFCYINLFDLKGNLQRSIKIHESDITYLIQMKNGDLLSCAIDGTMKIIRLGKNEGYKVIQIIDTTKEKVENSNPIFSNKLLVLLQIKSNENIITANGGILLFYKHPKDCKDTYEFNYIVSYNNKQENYYDMLFNNNSLSSLMEINNDNFIGLNNNTAIFFEKDEKSEDKYIVKAEIKNICASGGPNNIIYFNNKVIIGGGDNIYFIDTIEKKIIKDIKISCYGINCISINQKNDCIFIGYETKKYEFEIKEYNLINQENKIDIEEKRVIQKAHSSSISNIVALDLEEDEKDNNENVNPKVNFVSGAHDKYLKYWG